MRELARSLLRRLRDSFPKSEEHALITVVVNRIVRPGCQHFVSQSNLVIQYLSNSLDAISDVVVFPSATACSVIVS